MHEAKPDFREKMIHLFHKICFLNVRLNEVCIL